MSEQLQHFIKTNNIIQHGEFELASGKKSDFYCDIKRLALDSKGLALTIPNLLIAIIKAAPIVEWDKTNPYTPPPPRIDAIGGLELGSVPIVGAMLMHAATHHFYDPTMQVGHLKGFVVRKKIHNYGTQKIIEGPVTPGMKVAIIEDVVTTGESAMLAIEKCKIFGLKPVVVGCIVNRKEGADALFQAIHIPFVYLLEKSQL